MQFYAHWITKYKTIPWKKRSFCRPYLQLFYERFLECSDVYDVTVFMWLFFYKCFHLNLQIDNSCLFMTSSLRSVIMFMRDFELRFSRTSVTALKKISGLKTEISYFSVDLRSHFYANGSNWNAPKWAVSGVEKDFMPAWADFTRGPNEKGRHVTALNEKQALFKTANRARVSQCVVQTSQETSTDLRVRLLRVLKVQHKECVSKLFWKRL